MVFSKYCSSRRSIPEFCIIQSLMILLWSLKSMGPCNPSALLNCKTQSHRINLSASKDSNLQLRVTVPCNWLTGSPEPCRKCMFSNGVLVTSVSSFSQFCTYKDIGEYIWWKSETSVFKIFL